MPTAKKTATIEQLRTKLDEATSILFAQTQGMNAKELIDLRHKMRAVHVEVQVAKNTLLKIAAEKIPSLQIDPHLLQGQTTIILGYSDELASTQAATQYIATGGTKAFTIKAGFINKQPISKSQIEYLGNLPGGIAYIQQQIAGSLQSVPSTAYMTLTAPLQNLCRTLDAKIQQLQS